MTFTASAALLDLYAVNRARAGADYEWSGVAGCSRPKSDAAPGLVAWLRMRQEGLCAACGESLDSLDGNGRAEVLNVNHVHSQGSKQRGYVGGNVYLGHRICNEIDSDVFGKSVPLESLERADLVPTDYPDRATMLAMVPAKRDAKAERSARRLARMGA